MMKLRVTSFAVLLVSLLMLASGAQAGDLVKYDFTSAPFNDFYKTACPPTCKLTGWFTVATPLPPDLLQVTSGSGSFTPISFSFTDGLSTVTNLTATFSEFSVDTDASGKIVNWTVYADGASSQMFAYSDPPNETQEGNNAATYQAYFFGPTSGGVWTAATPTPEPSSLMLLGSGVLGLAGVARRKLKLSLTTKLAQSLGAIGAVAVLLFVGSGTAAASPSIAVTPYSPGNGVFYYDLAVPDATGTTFNNGDVIIFSGMSGVTSAGAVEEVHTDFGANVSVTPTRVIFTADVAPFYPSDTFPFDQGAPYSYFEIDSPFSAVGTINWSIQTADGTFSGTVLGPVAPTPEPSSMLLLGSGALGLAGMIRRKLRA